MPYFRGEQALSGVILLRFGRSMSSRVRSINWVASGPWNVEGVSAAMTVLKYMAIRPSAIRVRHFIRRSFVEKMAS